jgi:hypothetical protein
MHRCDAVTSPPDDAAWQARMTHRASQEECLAHLEALLVTPTPRGPRIPRRPAASAEVAPPPPPRGPPPLPPAIEIALQAEFDVRAGTAPGCVALI